MGAALATVATLVGIATGILTLRDQLFGGDGDDGPRNQGTAEQREIPRFDGIAGHFAEARAILDFLDQHDRGSVYLDVGFPDLGIGPAGGDNVVSRTVPFQGGTRYAVGSVTLVTECFRDIPAEETNPTPSDGCMGTELRIDGRETEDSETFFMHGVPGMKGYFLVDVTGSLHMGITTINLRPLTFDDARERAQ
jgi:hypothetical protein